MALTPGQQQALDNLVQQYRDFMQSGQAAIRTNHWSAAKADILTLKNNVDAIKTFVDSQPD